MSVATGPDLGSVVGLTVAGLRAVVLVDARLVVVDPTCGFLAAVLLPLLQAPTATTINVSRAHHTAAARRRPAPAVARP
jgi:hypothetical protein